MATKFLDPETRALLDRGFIRPLDCFIAVVEIFHLFGLAIWTIVGDPQAASILVALVCMALWLLVWVLSVAYRACYYVLKLTADVKMMPEQAASIAVQQHMNKINSPPVAPSRPIAK